MKQSMKRLKLSLWFVAIHTSLLIVTAVAIILSDKYSHNADSSLGFAMMCITFYIVDFPIGALFEASRPHFEIWGGWGWLLAAVFFFGILGNLMWFVFGTLVSLVMGALRRSPNQPSGATPEPAPGADSSADQG